MSDVVTVYEITAKRGIRTVYAIATPDEYEDVCDKLEDYIVKIDIIELSRTDFDALKERSTDEIRDELDGRRTHGTLKQV